MVLVACYANMEYHSIVLFLNSVVQAGFLLGSLCFNAVWVEF